jgi:hypothetical protein
MDLYPYLDLFFCENFNPTHYLGKNNLFPQTKGFSDFFIWKFLFNFHDIGFGVVSCIAPLL